MEQRKKRLQLRAWRRGTRELDLIFGTMVDRLIADLNETQIAQIEALLEEEDLLVYDWIIGRTKTPQQHEHEIMVQLRDFAKVAASTQLGNLG